jgi:cofilin
MIVLFNDRVPEGASIHDKSYYISNKDHLYYALEGISLHVQAHNVADLAHPIGIYSSHMS